MISIEHEKHHYTLCLNYNSLQGCNFGDKYLFTHEYKIGGNYKHELCKFHGDHHHKYCKYRFKYKFAINWKEYIRWNTNRFTKNEIINKCNQCIFSGYGHNNLCLNGNKCKYSKNITEQYLWKEVYRERYEQVIIEEK
jgi:hypothetical protein